MKSKYLFQIIAVLAILVSALGTGQQAQAQPLQAAQVILRDLTYWDATYTGYVDATRYEKWPLSFAGTQSFTVTAIPITANLSPLLLLLDSSGVEISRSVGSLTNTLPSGNYYVQIQPEANGGAYDLTIRQVVIVSSVTTVLNPSSVQVGQTSAAAVSLNNVPAEGYTSVEFTCTYDPALLEVSNIAGTDFFGADAVMIISGPQNGSFIVAFAGSNGNRSATSGAALTFSLKGLQLGQATVDCTARASTGNGVLTSLVSTGAASLPIVPTTGTITGQVFASKPVTISGTIPAPVAANADGTFSLTVPAATYTVIASAVGFLDAQGTAVVTAGNTTIMPPVTLLAGDIDNNDVINEFDALTIGMNYNAAAPAAADLNNDGVINVLDLELLASNYLKAGAIAW